MGSRLAKTGLSGGYELRSEYGPAEKRISATQDAHDGASVPERAPARPFSHPGHLRDADGIHGWPTYFEARGYRQPFLPVARGKRRPPGTQWQRARHYPNPGARRRPRLVLALLALHLA